MVDGCEDKIRALDEIRLKAVLLTSTHLTFFVQ